MKLSEAHQKKFAQFIEMCQQTQTKGDADIVIIHHPAVLGDTYEELITNLSLLAESGLALGILPPDKKEGV